MGFLSNLFKLALALLSIMTDKSSENKAKKKEYLKEMKTAIKKDDIEGITATFDAITRM